MSLIQCPECEGMVSTKAKACPHCGCPVELMATGTALCKINGVEYDLFDVLQIARSAQPGDDSRIKGRKLIKSITKLGLVDACYLWEEIVKNDSVPSSFSMARIIEEDAPKCPTCGSTNLTKIGAATRGIDRAFFGKHSPEAKAQFRCNKCGYLW